MEMLFLTIVNMSIISSYVILAVILLRFCIKKAPKKFSYALWGAVMFRLIVPFSFESIFSLVPINSTSLPPEILYAANPVLKTGISVLDNSVTLPSAVVGDSINPMQVIITVASIIWIIGMVCMVGYSVISYFMLQHKLKFATLIEDNIYENEYLKTPFVIGIIKPKIYLPNSLLEQSKHHILEHERTHIKRYDYLIKPLAFVVLSIHWFNPIVWLAFILLSKDMEMSCDEAVIAKLGNDIKKDYSSSLLSVSIGYNLLGGSPLAFCENNVKSRIKNVLELKRPALWMIIVLVLAITVASFGLIANPKGSASTTIDDLYACRTQYVGNNSSVGNIVNRLVAPKNLANDGIELQTTAPPYAVIIKYSSMTSAVRPAEYYAPYMDYNARILFSLVQNLDRIDIMIDSQTILSYNRDVIENTEGNLWEQSKTLGEFTVLVNKVSTKLDVDINNDMLMNNTFKNEFIITDETGQLRCEYIVDKDATLNRKQIIEKLDTLKGFEFNADTVNDRYIKFQFKNASPRKIFMLYCKDVKDIDDIQQEEYPMLSNTYMMKVPTEAGVYNFFADITLGNWDIQTVGFRIVIKN